MKNDVAMNDVATNDVGYVALEENRVTQEVGSAVRGHLHSVHVCATIAGAISIVAMVWWVYAEAYVRACATLAIVGLYCMHLVDADPGVGIWVHPSAVMLCCLGLPFAESPFAVSFMGLFASDLVDCLDLSRTRAFIVRLAWGNAFLAALTIANPCAVTLTIVGVVAWCVAPRGVRLIGASLLAQAVLAYGREYDVHAVPAPSARR